MRIGIDARVLLGRKTGDRTYTYNLVRALARAGSAHQFMLYFDREPDAQMCRTLSGLSLHVAERPGGYLWTLRALPRLAREDSLDLLHVQYLTPFAAPCPVVSTVQDISFRLYPQWFTWMDRTVMRLFMPGALRRTAAVIVPSQVTADALVDQYRHPRERIFVTPYAPGKEFHRQPSPAARQQMRDELALHEPYMLYVGNLQPRKNAARLIRAFVQAREAGELAERLVLAGQFAWKYAEERTLLEQAQAASHTLHIGYVEDKHLPALYAEATAFLFPTLYEGFGLPVLEAMAMGTPVLTANTSALPEVAGDAALLVDPTDEDTIADGIMRLATDSELRNRLSATGRARAAALSWEQTAQLTLQAYEVAGGIRTGN